MTRNTETHIGHIEDVLTYYHLNVYEWTACLIEDKCNLNLCVARSMDLPYVGCSSHKLNLEVMKMIENSNNITQTLENAKQIMQVWLSSSNNRAMLEILTDLSPILPSQTR